MLKAPKDAASLTYYDAWWVERRLLSREMLDLGNAKLAYRLVAAHAAESPAMAADRQISCRLYALRFLNDPRTARQHFSRIAELSSGPISAAHGFYWMGRTAEAMHEKDQASVWFQRAAHYGTTF